jgi:hypothetical protein
VPSAPSQRLYDLDGALLATIAAIQTLQSTTNATIEVLVKLRNTTILHHSVFLYEGPKGAPFHIFQ